MNAEEIAMLCSALSIKKKKSLVGTLDGKLKVQGEHRLFSCLVGKVIATKLVNRVAFREVTQKIWRVGEGVEIKVMEGKVFSFFFKNVDDRKRIQTGGPWTFDGAIIILEESTGSGEISVMRFKTVEF
ncbi:hypothetical protein Dsin_025895 [Dipteronia sinensis]|uniref:DUF4283 domain-containing protein n=1 Tax=Dipteronia sinensis TaxID=43782 RepID=A0AAD9ZWK0_9ROSI|nr:hypothetical protein Dsin_025895 [Dipteronia sinensis]